MLALAPRVRAAGEPRERHASGRIWPGASGGRERVCGKEIPILHGLDQRHSYCGGLGRGSSRGFGAGGRIGIGRRPKCVVGLEGFGGLGGLGDVCRTVGSDDRRRACEGYRLLSL